VIDFAELLVGLTEALPLDAGGPDAGIELLVESLEVTLPIEARLAADGTLLASFPRGRMATSLVPAHGKLATVFCVRGD
jgi:hypothetical protein